MSKRQPPNQSALSQRRGLQSNRRLPRRQHRNRDPLEPTESRSPQSQNSAYRTRHQRDDVRGPHHHGRDDERTTRECAGEVSARSVQLRWSRHANEATYAPA